MFPGQSFSGPLSPEKVHLKINDLSILLGLLHRGCNGSSSKTQLMISSWFQPLQKNCSNFQLSCE